MPKPPPIPPAKTDYLQKRIIGIFSLTTAFLAIVGGVGCVWTAARFRSLCEDMDVPLSGLSRSIVSTSGWFPGGLLLVLAVLIVVVVAVGRIQKSFYLSVPTALLLIASVVVLPYAMIRSISGVVQDLNKDMDLPDASSASETRTPIPAR